HWLPLFHERMDTLFDYVADAPLVLDPLAEDAAGERLAQVKDYHDARKQAHDSDPAKSSYKPLPPDALYLSPSEWRERLEAHALARTAPFEVPAKSGEVSIDCGGR